MTSRGSRAGLLGRQGECQALDNLLAEARAGRSGVLVVRGEAGIGKTELLKYLIERATGCRTVSAAGVQSEMELSYAGLHQLCAPLLAGLDNLPEPQRDALCTAFGLRGGATPDRFLVGLATLSLLADAGGDEPLVVVVDDAQWLDHVSAQALEFVARRLLAESVVLVVAVREPSAGELFTGTPELPVPGLSEDDSRRLLASVVTGPLDRRVRDRIVAETRGNPLALLELPRALIALDPAGAFGPPEAEPLANRLEQDFLRRVESLPDETRRLLFVAAAEPVGDVTLLRRAAQQLGIAMDTAAVRAEASGLITLGTWVRFRHPLVRSAAYRAADPEHRRAVHKALADATDARLDPDRRAWHLARAATGLDEGVAAELERSAGRAQARGGVAAAAAFLDRAAQLTPDPVRRGARALAAAQAKYQAGAFDAARELADAAELGPLDELGAARSTLLHGRIMAASRSAGAGLPLLLQAARRLEPLDAGLARETYRDAIYAALTAGRLPEGSGIREVAQAVLRAPKPAEPTRDDLLLDGLARVYTAGYAAGAPMLLQAIGAYRADGVSGREGLGWLPLACRLAHSMWDFASWSVLSARLVDLARETGALSVLPSALLLRLSNRAFAGDLDSAHALVAEATAIGEATGSTFFAHYSALVVEPWKGRESTTRQAIEALTRDSLLRGEGKVETATQWAAAVLYNGLGRYEEAYAAARRGCENPDEFGLSLQSTMELVEASARLGRPEDAAEGVRWIGEMAQASGTDWALGTAAGARALVSEGPSADALYREAIERLGATEMRMYLARTRLLYGEWLRRENRRVDARVQLGAAHDMLSSIGAEAFAERARRELQATGAKVARRPTATHEPLTPQEEQIARLVGDGLTNPEIGAQLFISPHTVEWHLRKVFSKLGITSRKEIRTLRLAGEATPA
ncbi:AAA family ATPase [Streptomyces sp. NBC_00201]|uniref:helix-turn-helix transcriptional regulator n=1 Tax=unclassified Streptomyces TaxID=2593676 RepID=UPI00225AFDC2|nr:MULTISPECIES: LuxR family transcriptional regulator [unclassified Streptomyces]MCX5251661.1 AAA family ATPase [Streptomyces sp. NBC_00201]MCX5294414.1 AAA family ATPase [Streptomyces sp. NBC_00183]